MAKAVYRTALRPPPRTPTVPPAHTAGLYLSIVQMRQRSSSIGSCLKAIRTAALAEPSSAFSRTLSSVTRLKALEPRAQLGDARAGVRASAVLVDAAERAAHQVEVGDLRVPQDGSELADALGADAVEGEVERGHLAQG